MRYQAEMHDRRLLQSFALLLVGLVTVPAALPARAGAAPAGVQAAPLVAEKEHGDGDDQGDHGDRGDRGDHGGARGRNVHADEATEVRGGIVRGTVASVDYARNMLYVDAGGSRQRIQLTPTTTLERHGSRISSIADLRQGQQVDVFLTVVGGMPIAQIIRMR
ncbi:hypothetical protein EPN52_14065 [bacterium]|nr:MAG: hypothetical protein EPN52_14065 [bacterium]